MSLIPSAPFADFRHLIQGYVDQNAREILLPLINKDFPALYAFEFQNAVLSPGIVLQFFPDLIFIFSIEDQQSAAFIDQRTAHQNETVVNQLIDELRVLVPKRLLTRTLGEIAIRTSGRNCQEYIFHDKRTSNVHAYRQPFGSSAIRSTTFPRLRCLRACWCAAIDSA